MSALAPIAAAGVLYLLGASRARSWPARRTAAFAAGLLALAAALAPPLHARAEELLSAHMVQHMLLVLAAPPLLLLGAPLSLAMRTLPAEARGSLARALHSRAAGAFANPALGWTLLTAVVVGTHAPWFYDAAIGSPALHGLEHLLYLFAGLAFWLPLLAVEPLPRAPSPLTCILVLLAAMPPMAFVGVGLMAAGEVLYPSYGTSAAALADQEAAGRLMFAGGNALLAAITLTVGWGAVRREERRQRLREAYADRRGPDGGGGP